MATLAPDPATLRGRGYFCARCSSGCPVHCLSVGLSNQNSSTATGNRRGGFLVFDCDTSGLQLAIAFTIQKRYEKYVPLSGAEPGDYYEPSLMPLITNENM